MRQASFPEVGGRAVRGDAPVDNVEAQSWEKRRSASAVISASSNHAATNNNVLVTTVMLFLLYVVPFQLSVQLGLDADVNFWLGSATFYVAVALPIFLIFVHLLHVQLAIHGMQRRWFLNISVLILTIVLAVLCGVFLNWTRKLQHQLELQDCTKGKGFVDKPLLQEAYVDALKTYDACVSRLFNENGQQPLTRRPLLQMCKEFYGNGQDLSTAQNVTNATYAMQRLFAKRDARVRSDRLFNYLAQVEQHHKCGGFCRHGPRLWTPPSPKDEACSRFVGLKFKTVRGLFLRLLATSVIAGLIAFSGIRYITKDDIHVRSRERLADRIAACFQ